jgi:hypothetical protein
MHVMQRLAAMVRDPGKRRRVDQPECGSWVGVKSGHFLRLHLPSKDERMRWSIYVHVSFLMVSMRACLRFQTRALKATSHAHDRRSSEPSLLAAPWRCRKQIRNGQISDYDPNCLVDAVPSGAFD